MNKFTLFLALLVLSCNQNKKLDTLNSKDIPNSTVVKKEDTSEITFSDSNLLIIPGKSIGDTALLDDSATLEKFGKPSFSDAAMGKAWLLWPGFGLDATGKITTLAVFVTYNGSDMTKQVIKRIRITSPDFKTAEFAHTGMTFEEIEKLYPSLVFDSKMSNSDSTTRTKFYTIKNTGISFEFQNFNNSQICTAIAIASVEEISDQPYLDLDSAENLR